MRACGRVCCCIMKYYSALKGKEIQTHVTIWMNSENITLSEICQTQKEKYCMILLIYGASNNQIHREAESRMMLPGAKIPGNGELVFNGYRVCSGDKPIYLK